MLHKDFKSHLQRTLPCFQTDTSTFLVAYKVDKEHTKGFLAIPFDETKNILQLKGEYNVENKLRKG